MRNCDLGKNGIIVLGVTNDKKPVYLGFDIGTLSVIEEDEDWFTETMIKYVTGKMKVYGLPSAESIVSGKLSMDSVVNNLNVFNTAFGDIKIPSGKIIKDSDNMVAIAKMDATRSLKGYSTGYVCINTNTLTPYFYTQIDVTKRLFSDKMYKEYSDIDSEGVFSIKREFIGIEERHELENKQQAENKEGYVKIGFFNGMLEAKYSDFVKGKDLLIPKGIEVITLENCKLNKVYVPSTVKIINLNKVYINTLKVADGATTVQLQGLMEYKYGETAVGVKASIGVYGKYNEAWSKVKEVVLPKTVKRLLPLLGLSIERINTENIEVFEKDCLYASKLDVINAMSARKIENGAFGDMCRLREIIFSDKLEYFKGSQRHLTRCIGLKVMHFIGSKRTDAFKTVKNLSCTSDIGIMTYGNVSEFKNTFNEVK